MLLQYPEYLRETCRLTGTKLGCGVGGCGVCTIMLSRMAPDDSMVHSHVNSCLPGMLTQLQRGGPAGRPAPLGRQGGRPAPLV
jgi:xanthine dehydrogenase iron-sulfur cluster and FAD-binding subunit A